MTDGKRGLKEARLPIPDFIYFRARRNIVKGKKPFRITSIEADCDCFEFGTLAEDAVKPLHLVPVTFIAGESGGKIAKTIRITTDLDEAPIALPTYAAVAQD